MENQIAVARAKAQQGERLTLQDALALYEDNDLLFLAECARKLKERKSGKNVFYNVNRHINLTNICTSNCPLCAFQCQQGSSMTGREISLLDEPLDLLREGQQAHGVGHGGAGLAHPMGGLLLGEAILLDEGPVTGGLFHGVQVLTLEVFDEADLHDLPVVGLDDQGRNFQQARHPGGPPAAFTGDDLVIARGQAPHRQGLQNPVLTDGLGKFCQGFFVKMFSGLVQARFHLGDG